VPRIHFDATGFRNDFSLEVRFGQSFFRAGCLIRHSVNTDHATARAGHY